MPGLRRQIHVLGHRLRRRLRRRPRLVPGQTLDIEIAAPGGVVQAIAGTRVDAETLVVFDVAIYRRGTGLPLAGRPATGWLLAELRWLEREACVLGFECVRIEGYRSSGSSAAQPGRHVQFEWRIRCRRR